MNDHSSDDTTTQSLTAKAARLLGEGKLPEARQLLERLIVDEPKSAKIRGLLALTLFKMNVYDQASVHYERLVHDNPIDATLRVNLGLVYVKSENAARAIEELEIALDLEPDHKKAHGYLGLALAQVGQYERAQSCFIRAGNLSMAERMEQALKDKADSRPPQASLDANSALVSARTNTEAPIRATGGVFASEPALESAAIELDAEAVAQAPKAASAETRGARSDRIQTVVGKLRFGAEGISLSGPPDSQAVPSIGEGDGDPFALGAPGAPVEVHVRHELHSRLNGLLVAMGELNFTPLQKRFQGAPIEQPFGRGQARMLRVSGQGALSLAPQGKTFVSARLTGQAAFFQEKWLYAFEPSLSFENGRIPIVRDRELELVYLNGTGHLLLSLPGPLLARPIRDTACYLPLEGLVGWSGRLVPRAAPFPEENGQQPTADTPTLVELTGSGVVLFTHTAKNG
ncbi:MAG: tetratricopeptide repeat protein [Myxococcales bacterium]|jgi:tetratricopeptide (TPR) repeat protein|nr:tetratricopeptide repeat protein [Myxococcales bacterium]